MSDLWRGGDCLERRCHRLLQISQILSIFRRPRLFHYHLRRLCDVLQTHRTRRRLTVHPGVRHQFRGSRSALRRDVQHIRHEYLRLVRYVGPSATLKINISVCPVLIKLHTCKSSLPELIRWRICWGLLLGAVLKGHLLDNMMYRMTPSDQMSQAAS